jgi:inorganic pyrophosphatase
MNQAQGHYRFRPHPWHGLSAGIDPPRLLNAYVEITPFDLMKYEIDKSTGYLKVDRPQLGSSLPPTPYGFVPQTFCAARVAELSPYADRGDEDPLDICVLTERPISRAEVILHARVIGVLRTLDDGRADDKIVAVLSDDALWDRAQDISDVQGTIVNRLQHYFATYKMTGTDPERVKVLGVDGCEQALAIVQAARSDYEQAFACEPTSTRPLS